MFALRIDPKAITFMYFLFNLTDTIKCELCDSTDSTDSESDQISVIRYYLIRMISGFYTSISDHSNVSIDLI